MLSSTKDLRLRLQIPRHDNIIFLLLPLPLSLPPCRVHFTATMAKEFALMISLPKKILGRCLLQLSRPELQHPSPHLYPVSRSFFLRACQSLTNGDA